MDREPHDIAGVWRGAYFYDNPPPADCSPGGVEFELRLTRNAWQRLWGRFSGTVTDDPVRGMPGTGTVKGRISDHEFTFTKSMPVMYIKSGEGSIRLSQALRNAGHELAREIRHPPLCYSGKFLSETKASGIWRAESCTIFLGRVACFMTMKGSGTFTLWRP